MAIDIGSFLPQQVIFHKVPKARLSEKDLTALEPAEAPIELNPRLIRYFRERIVESLQKRFDVVYGPPPADPEDGSDGQPVAVADRSSIPQLIVDFFKGNGDNFVAASQTMAESLYLGQKGVSNEGILVLIEGTVTSGKSAGKCLVVPVLDGLRPPAPAEGRALGPGLNVHRSGSIRPLRRSRERSPQAVIPAVPAVGDGRH